MTAIANASQFEAWNGDSGRRWVDTADQRDQVLSPVADALLAVASPAAGERVLDVGCGCGATTITASERLGATGAAIGIDLSAPMLEVARARASAAGAANTTFVHGDAQTHAFAPGSIDLVISRFGTMFFADPHVAFANIGSILREGGRMCLATWQPLAANEWLTVPGVALLAHAPLPAADPSAPGMFAQSDPAVVAETLRGAGFTDVDLEPTTVSFTLGRTLGDAVAYLADSGPGRAMLESIPEGPRRDAALADVHEALVGHHDGSGVHLSGGIWLVTATR